MLPRLFTLLFLTSLTLGLSASSCSKKDDPTSPATLAAGTGSFKRDGVAVTGTARAYTNAIVTGNVTTDLLQLTIVDTPQLQSTTQSLTVSFTKPSGQPTSAYQLSSINFGLAQPTSTSVGSSYPSTTSKATLQETSTGVFSCTFSGTGTTTNSIQTTLTDGVITDARL